MPRSRVCGLLLLLFSSFGQKKKRRVAEAAGKSTLETDIQLETTRAEEKKVFLSCFRLASKKGVAKLLFPADPVVMALPRHSAGKKKKRKKEGERNKSACFFVSRWRGELRLSPSLKNVF